MTKDKLIKEGDFLKWPDEQQRLYTFRLLQQVSQDIKAISGLKIGCNTVASFIGGLIGGAIAVLANFKLKVF